MANASDFKCYVCGKGLLDGISVYRQNEKGIKGIWACVDHMRSDPITEEMVQDVKDVLSGATEQPKDMRIIQ